MAKVNNAFDTYTATADREDLSNIIYNISPMQTPFMSSIGTRNVKNVVFDWQTESLPTPSGAGQLEGFEGGYQYRRIQVSGERYDDRPEKNRC